MAETPETNLVAEDKNNAPEFDEVVDSVMGSLDELRFFRLLMKSLLLMALLFGAGAIVKGLFGLGVRFYPVVLGLILS